MPTDTLQHTYAGNASYTAWVYAYRDCGSVDSASVNVVISGIGMGEKPTKSLVISPNPSRGTLTLRGGDVAHARLVNAQGQLVAEIRNWTAGEAWVLPEGFANGIYSVVGDLDHFLVLLER